MAELELAPTTSATRWTAAQTRAQLGAIARLRWRITVNSFRRKGGAGELVARILIYPLLAGLALGPTIGAGLLAFYFADTGRLDRIALLLWGTFVLCQLLNIQLGQPGSTFDPTQLIRFPLSARRYVLIRLFFGLLTPANVVGTLMSLAIAVGVSVQFPGLWLYALVALAVFAAANVLFSRMVFAWVDRWLSTRRAREIFTAFVFFISLGIQWLNFSYNPAYNRHSHGQADPSARINAFVSLYHRAPAVLQWLPPELTTRALLAGAFGQTGAFVGLTLGCAAFAAAFLGVFALRMKTEFRGENLSDAANAVVKPARKAVVARTIPAAAIALAPEGARASSSFLSHTMVAMLGKEFLYIRRNMGLFYSVVAPLVFVFLFAGKLATRGSSAWVFPAAVAYTLLGIAPLSYNSFGLEGPGAQFYFMAPVRLREVFLAKNALNFAVALVEAAAVFGIVCYVAGLPPLASIVTALLWSNGTLLLTTILGNRRSISAPKQVNLSRAAGKQASPLSALISMGVLLGSASIAGVAYAAAFYFHVTWPLVPFFALFFAGALWAYATSLNSLDRFAAEHREELFAELCKKL